MSEAPVPVIRLNQREPSTDKAETVPVMRFAGAEHAERMLAHLTKTVERITEGQKFLHQFAGTDEIYIVSENLGRRGRSLDVYDNLQSATNLAEDCENEGNPKSDYIGCIRLHPDGTWSRVELFPEHGR